MVLFCPGSVFILLYYVHSIPNNFSSFFHLLYFFFVFYTKRVLDILFYLSVHVDVLKRKVFGVGKI